MAYFINTVEIEARNRNIQESKIKKWKDSLPDSLISFINQDRFNDALLSNGLLNSNYWHDAIELDNEKANHKWNNMVTIIDTLLNGALKNEITPGLVFIPCRFLYDSSSYNSNNPWVLSGCNVKREWLVKRTEIQKRLSDWTASKDIPFLDLTPVFRKQSLQSKELFNHKLDGHWNEVGHEIAAKAIQSWIKNQNLFYIKD